MDIFNLLFKIYINNNARNFRKTLNKVLFKRFKFIQYFFKKQSSFNFMWAKFVLLEKFCFYSFYKLNLKYLWILRVDKKKNAKLIFTRNIFLNDRNFKF